MKPSLQALLIADHVYEDRTTGKKIIAGVFNRVRMKTSKVSVVVDEAGRQQAMVVDPTQAGSPYAYLSLTDIHGSQRLQLRFVSLADHGLLVSADIEVESKSPLNMAEVIVPLPMLPMSRPGAYALEVVWNDEVLGAFRISATKDTPPEGRSDEQRT